MSGFLKLIIAVGLFPAVWGNLQAFIAGISPVAAAAVTANKYFLAGLMSYPLFQIIFSHPLRTYVFGHELTHAAAAVMLGGRVKRFKISARGGSVTLTKTNFFVSLAPYFVPLYTLIIMAGYYVTAIWIDMKPYYSLLLFSVGFSLSFHCALTIFAVKQRQPDITQTGVVFSLVFIIISIMWVIMGILNGLFPSHIHLRAFAGDAVAYSRLAYACVFQAFMYVKQQVAAVEP